MSPEIRINGELIADLPDETGHYQTPVGELYCNIDGIGQGEEAQEIILQGQRLNGKQGRKTETGLRKVQLSRKGTGSQQLSPTETLEVSLRNQPISKDHKIGTMWWGKQGTCFTSPRKELPIYVTRYHPRWRKGSEKI